MLGVIDLLLPGERATLGEPIVDTVSELQRLDVLASELDLADIAGFDITLDERTVVVESTNVADVAHVRLSADAIVTVDGADIPIGSLITDNVPDDAMTELRGSRSTENDTFDVELTAVEEDGRWYFSAWYSVAELARESAGIADIPVEGVGAFGADSPEAAVDRFVDQLAALDVRGMIQSLDPFEAAALQRYAPLVLPGAEAAVADLDIDMFEVTGLAVRYEGSGSTRTAFIDAIAVEISDDGYSFRFSYSDGCSRFDWSGDDVAPEPIEFCGTDLDLTDRMAGIELPPEMEVLGQTVSDAFADMEPTGIELRERNGEWFVSPLSTVGEAWLGVLRALDRDELDAIIEVAPPAFEAMVDEVVGGGMFDQALGGLSGDVTVPDDSLLDGSAGSVDAIGGDDGASAPDAISECYETVDAAEAKACFDDLVTSGEGDEWLVPIVLRFPECGLSEIMWSNDIYTASDDEFVAVITAARPCFGELVANGTIEGWEVPYEVSEFDCFENRNWYATFDDPEYSDRVAACLAGE
jgi:hypothetical protein